ncbi:PepSY domain-containing protein [Streptomyces humi]|uniref:PepSY domain-containing protein n=1 Tax=Streptomyces humi TaxID=1428620 RepID=UPI000628780E|nr:PepSY domain-containing protein [Streptomyces humi]
MATSKVLAHLESRKNLTGSAGGLLGLVLTFTGVAGPYWPVVVAGLYGAGALIAPPERPAPPDFPTPSAQLNEVRGDFEQLGAYLAEVDLPPAAAGRLTELRDLLAALLDPGWAAELLAQDPEGVHVLSRAVRQDIPEAVDSFVRTRWWTRMAPGQEPPERHLERQLAVLKEEAEQLAAGLGETEARRQETHTRYLEERGN